MSKPIFDRIVIGRDPPRELSTADFLRLSLSEKTRYLLTGEIKFFREGVEVSTSEALASMRKAAAADLKR
jgi:hypothetical protein